MNREEHCKESKKLFGDSGEEYHVWIDRYSYLALEFHRQVLHNKEGIEVGVQLFGEEARKHLEQHIIDDYELDNVEDIPAIKELRKTSESCYPKRIPPVDYHFWR